MMPNRARRGEDGAALELALVFLTAIALFVGVLISFTDTSSRATVATRTLRSTDYDTDSAMQAGIATLRVSTTLGYTAGNCGAFTPTFTLNNPARPVRVDCTALAPPTSAQRHVVLSVCPTSVAAGSCPDASALLRADVIFFDDQGIGRALSIQTWSNQ
jgi:hypothetical protein